VNTVSSIRTDRPWGLARKDTLSGFDSLNWANDIGHNLIFPLLRLKPHSAICPNFPLAASLALRIAGSNCRALGGIIGKAGKTRGGVVVFASVALEESRTATSS